MANVINYFE